jgi:hypothetical protein
MHRPWNEPAGVREERPADRRRQPSRCPGARSQARWRASEKSAPERPLKNGGDRGVQRGCPRSVLLGRRPSAARRGCPGGGDACSSIDASGHRRTRPSTAVTVERADGPSVAALPSRRTRASMLASVVRPAAPAVDCARLAVSRSAVTPARPIAHRRGVAPHRRVGCAGSVARAATGTAPRTSARSTSATRPRASAR